MSMKLTLRLTQPLLVASMVILITPVVAEAPMVTPVAMLVLYVWWQTVANNMEFTSRTAQEMHRNCSTR